MQKSRREAAWKVERTRRGEGGASDDVDSRRCQPVRPGNEARVLGDDGGLAVGARYYGALVTTSKAPWASRSRRRGGCGDTRIRGGEGRCFGCALQADSLQGRPLSGDNGLK